MFHPTSRKSSEAPPSVSIVIATHNSSAYIGETLDSVRAQTFTDFETIVVNDGSRDTEELERILESHPLPIIYIRQENRGVSAARNAGIKVARGKFYAQLDADDQWEPDYLAVQLRFLMEHPDIALVYPNAIIFGDSSAVGVEFMELSKSQGEVSFESLVAERCVVLTCVTARMSVIRSVGMFDEAIRSCEDFDLWLRIIKSGSRISYHRHVLARYRKHGGSLSSDRVWMTRNLLAVFEKCARTLNLTSAETEVLNEQITVKRATLSLFEGKRALSAVGASAALIHFKKANEDLRSPKLALVIFLLRHVPRLVIWTFAARERLLVKQPKHQLTGFDHPQETPSEAVRATDESECIS
jgi:glycosyltransferase involved in cell wall biosynthesis